MMSQWCRHFSRNVIPTNINIIAVPPKIPAIISIWNLESLLLTLTKTVPKSHQTDTLGLFHSYIGHICTKCSIYLTNISPIYHKSQGHISVIWIWEKCEKFRPPSSQSSLHLKCRQFPPYGLFLQFVTFFVWKAPLTTISQLFLNSVEQSQNFT